MCKTLLARVAGLFGMDAKPMSVPSPVAPPPMPAMQSDTTATVAERMAAVGTAASEEERLRQARARGRASTLLTGGQGVTDAPVLARPMAGAGTRALLG